MTRVGTAGICARARVRACLRPGCVRAHTPRTSYTIRHHVICWGEPWAPGRSAGCAESPGRGQEAGRRDGQRPGSGSPAHRDTVRGGDARARPFSPRSESTSVKTHWISQAGQSPRRGRFLLHALGRRPPDAEKAAAAPFRLNISQLKTPYKNVELFFGIVSVLARREDWNTDWLLGSRK